MEPVPAPLEAALRALTSGGHTPVLVGGFAARLLGFPELTEDFDLDVGGKDPERKAAAVRLMYGVGFRLVSRLDDRTGEPAEFVGSEDDAAVHVRSADPSVAFFWEPSARVRVDLLFDFPLPAADLARRARRVADLPVASAEDLRDLYRTSYNYRRHPKDLRALEFVEAFLREAEK